jgi:hypothetical protein
MFEMKDSILQPWVGDTIAQRVAQGAILERQHKLMQFRLLF